MTMHASGKISLLPLVATVLTSCYQLTLSDYPFDANGDDSGLASAVDSSVLNADGDTAGLSGAVDTNQIDASVSDGSGDGAGLSGPTATPPHSPVQSMQIRSKQIRRK